MKRHWIKITLWLLAMALGMTAFSGGLIMQANAAGPNLAQNKSYRYGPVNCHSNPTLPDTSGSKQQYADYIVNTIAPRYHLEAAVLLWQVNQESGFNPDAYSPAGAIGIAQFMPATAAAYGINPWDPWQSLDGMARYDLDSLRAFWGWSHTIAVDFGGNRNSYAWGLALAAYNAGGGATGAAVGWASSQGWYDGPWTWLWWFGNANQTFYYVPDILGCEATS
ncbi:MAG TPA: transglycosylase SLT domain-containing protein [Ktedonobacterales bacterium]|nr:transglycosylase SLT domain-containing protein [Ktedonobacterales bacterium]